MGGTFRNTPPGNAGRGFYEVSKVLPFLGQSQKWGSRNEICLENQQLR